MLKSFIAWEQNLHMQVNVNFTEKVEDISHGMHISVEMGSASNTRLH